MLNLETFGDELWAGHSVKSFRWSNPNDDHGLKRNYLVRLLGREIASLTVFYPLPPSYLPHDTLWQMVPWFVLQSVLLIVGFFQRERVDLRSRWRIIVAAFCGFMWGWLVWLTMMAPLVPLSIGRSIALITTILLGLAYGFVTFFALIPIEQAVRNTAPAKFSTFFYLFKWRAASESCGLAILRGTLIGLGLLGIDTFLIWLATTKLGNLLDSFSVINLQVRLFLNETSPAVMAISYPLVIAVSIALVIALVISVLSRVLSRRWLVLFLGATFLAAILRGPTITMGAIQPYLWKVPLLFIELLILAFTFRSFDVLTLTAAVFTFLFCLENYKLLVMFWPLGTFEQSLSFVVWASFVAGAAAIAYKSSILAAYRRISITLQ